MHMADEPDALERLQKRLYANQDLPEFSLPQLRPKAPSYGTPAVQPAWQPPPTPPAPPPAKPGMPWASKFLLGAILFFVLAGVAAAGIFLLGARSVSSDNVSIDVQGPVSIASGDTVALLVTVRNENPAAITSTSLVVDLPEGARQAADKTLPFDHYTDSLGDLAPGGEASRTVSAVLFGAQQQELTIPIKVEYRTEGSNALFVAEETYVVRVTTSPLELTVSGAAEAASGEPFTLAVRLRSNAATPLENVAVRIDYPFGFTLSDAAPRPQQGSLFGFGTLAPGEERTITLTGVLTGSDADERFFRFAAGTLDAGGALNLTYATADAPVRVAKPFLATTLSLNRDTADVVQARPGEAVSGMLTWQNNLTVPVTDAQIAVRLSGSGFDPSSVSTQSGFYRSTDSTILFSKDTNRDLAQLQPGASGTGSFSFMPKSAAQLAGVANPTVTLTVSIAGNRVSQGQVPERVASTVTKTVRIGTSIDFVSRIVRSSGPFTNTGPLPPRPDTETTYTVELTATNALNSVSGGTTSIVLPSYVRFTGSAQPADGSVVYDERTRTVTWRVGDIDGGQAKKAYFQVAFLPSSSQRGTSPVLVPEHTFTAVDDFSREQLTVRANRLTTQDVGDSGFDPSRGTVQ